MKKLKISNTGIIEPGALTLLGASTKRGDDTKIGMFGSGNKYAIACFLRNNIGIKIFSGKNEIKIDTTKKVFSEQTFDVVCVDGKETSITTQTGHLWKVWQAIREIYCNAIDEGKMEISVVDEIIPEKENTHFYLELTDEVADIVENIKDYFSKDKKVLFENEIGQILEKHGAKTCIYRKGIKVWETEKRSLFDYNFHQLTINESRCCTYNWAIYEKIYKLITACNKKTIIRQFLQTSKEEDYIEGSLKNSTGLPHSDGSNEFKEVLGNMVVYSMNFGGYLKEDEKLNIIFLEHILYSRLMKDFPDDIRIPSRIKGAFTKHSFVLHDMTPLQEQILAEVLRFFAECKYKIKYDIEVVSFFEKNISGSIDREHNKLLISDNAFEKGKSYIASVIIEEQCHMEHNVNDETRDMQNVLIEMFLTYMKERNAHTL